MNFLHNFFYVFAKDIYFDFFKKMSCYYLPYFNFEQCHLTQFYYLTLTVLRADLIDAKFTYPGVLRALHIGPNFKV